MRRTPVFSLEQPRPQYRRQPPGFAVLGEHGFGTAVLEEVGGGVTSGLGVLVGGKVAFQVLDAVMDYQQEGQGVFAFLRT